MFVRTLLSLPFSVYATFVIEERFGFNKTTPMTFITDLLKGLGLAIVIGGSLLAGVLAFFEYAGAYAWLYCWIVDHRDDVSAVCRTNLDYAAVQQVYPS